MTLDIHMLKDIKICTLAISTLDNISPGHTKTQNYHLKHRNSYIKHHHVNVFT
jgi:hypothetical protein